MIRARAPNTPPATTSGVARDTGEAAGAGATVTLTPGVAVHDNEPASARGPGRPDVMHDNVMRSFSFV